jgi:hypothetical protein
MPALVAQWPLAPQVPPETPFCLALVLDLTQAD